MQKLNKAAVIKYLRTLPNSLKTEAATMYAEKFKTTAEAYRTSLSRSNFGDSELYFLGQYLQKNNLIPEAELFEAEKEKYKLSVLTSQSLFEQLFFRSPTGESVVLKFF